VPLYVAKFGANKTHPWFSVLGFLWLFLLLTACFSCICC